MLGEAVLAASLAFESGLGSGADADLIWLAAAGIIIVFAMWWIYFDRETVPTPETASYGGTATT